MTKAAIAQKKLMDWNWDRTMSAQELTPNELVRAVCLHIHNLQMTPAGVFGYYGANGFDCQIRFDDHGRFKRAVVENGRVLAYQAPANIEGARKLWARFARFCHYMRETRHAWEFVRRVHYADNSLEAEYRSHLTGEIRRVMELAPSGDACF